MNADKTQTRSNVMGANGAQRRRDFHMRFNFLLCAFAPLRRDFSRGVGVREA
jgi:hypothetical protein